MIDVAHAEFNGTGAYGYEGTELGRTSFFVRIAVNGAETLSHPVRFTSTRGVRDLYIEGERLYVSTTYPGGNAVRPASWAHAGPYTVNADTMKSWPAPGYRSREDSTSLATIAHEWVWRDPSSSYPGQWWFYVKSNLLHLQTSGAYWFTDDGDLPADPANSGWRQT